DAWVLMAIHSTIACYLSTAFAIAGVYAAGILKGADDAYHRRALHLALAVGGVMAVLQPLSGDLLAKFVFRTQPAKFAAMEAHFPTESHAALHIGGIPDTAAHTIRWAISIPGGLSFLAAHDLTATVKG